MYYKNINIYFPFAILFKLLINLNLPLNTLILLLFLTILIN